MLKLICLSLFVLESESYRLQIINGNVVKSEDFPYQLTYKTRNKFVCGASIISEKFALTAGHCVSFHPRNVTLQAGSPLRESGGVTRKVVNIIRHPKYNFTNFDYDIAVLEVDIPFNFSDTIKPISLPNSGEELPDGVECVVSGWGLTEFLDYSLELRATKVATVNFDVCQLNYMDTEVHTNVTTNMFCAGAINATEEEGNNDSCSGDSGGPLVCRGILYGIVSSGFGCGYRAYPGIYTKNSAVRNWIRKCTEV